MLTCDNCLLSFMTRTDLICHIPKCLSSSNKNDSVQKTADSESLVNVAPSEKNNPKETLMCKTIIENAAALPLDIPEGIYLINNNTELVQINEEVFHHTAMNELSMDNDSLTDPDWIPPELEGTGSATTGNENANTVDTDPNWVQPEPEGTGSETTAKGNDDTLETDADWISLEPEGTGSGTTGIEIEDTTETDPDWVPPEPEGSGTTGKENEDTIETLCEGRKRMGEIENEEAADKSITAKKRCRWNKADSSTWVRNVAKERRSLGKSYEVKGRYFSEKQPKRIDCTKCIYKCTVNFNEDDRTAICSSYWKLKDYNRKKDFILSNVTARDIQRRKVITANNNKRTQRSNAKIYSFKKNQNTIRVCKQFFMNTLGINNGPINSAFQNVSEAGTFVGNDRRGKHDPSNKIPEAEIERVKQHIERFPVTESHYIRQSSERKYLDSKLSLSIMYSLYKEECEKSEQKPVCLTTYKRIFSLNYNYSFFKPRKDLCQMCVKYDTIKNDEESEEKHNFVVAYEEHKMREKEANEAKAADKLRATNDQTFVTATFDLESVLQIPSSDVSPMYYTRKICCYNLTVYEGAPPNNAECYTWTEIEGKRGSIEIGTCLYLFLTNLPPQVNEVTLFSDTCAGQNRNQNVVALLWYVVQTTTINKIEQKFLESGHSMMECDSMHSAIEKRKKFVSVFTMHDWLNIFRSARSSRNRKNAEPYKVTELKHNDFYNLKKLSNCLLKNKNRDTDGAKVNWLKIKCIKFEKSHPETIFFRYGHSGDYKEIKIFGRSRRTTGNNICFEKAYTSNFPISDKKYSDLQRLCKTGVIPVEFHAWYNTLPHCDKPDRNPGPSAVSDTEDEEN